MKHNHRNQIVSLERFTEVARKSVNMRVAGVLFLSYGVCAPFWGLGWMPFWLSVLIASMWGGLVWYNGANYIEAQVAVWIDRLMEIEVSDESKDVEQQIIIEEPELMNVAIITQGTDQGWTVRISPDQLRQLIEANMMHRKLKRSHLTPQVWPNLSRRWASGEIQRVSRIIGMTDIHNNFLAGWGGSPVTDLLEVDRPTDTGSGVGGYENG